MVPQHDSAQVWGIGPPGEALLGQPLSVLFIKGEHGLPRVARRQLSHHFGVLQVCPHIKILAALVKHLSNNSAIGSNPHGWGHLVQFWLGLSFSVTLPPNATSSSANRDDDMKSTIWWHPPAVRCACAPYAAMVRDPRSLARSGPAMSP